VQAHLDELKKISERLSRRCRPAAAGAESPRTDANGQGCFFLLPRSERARSPAARKAVRPAAARVYRATAADLPGWTT